MNTIMQNGAFLLFAFVLSVLACNAPKPQTQISLSPAEIGAKRIDSLNQHEQWREMKCGLWISKDNKIAFKTTGATDEGRGTDIEYFLTEIDGNISLAEFVDTTTFHYLGSSFYKDKNHVYTHYGMVYGGRFWVVVEADVKTFRVIGSCYAKDKYHIFGERAMQMDSVDYATFKTCDECGCFAKDKYHFYFWDSVIEDNSEDSIQSEAIKKLKTL